MLYRECYESGAKALEEAGIADAALDARLLLEDICQTSRTDLYVHGDREVSDAQYAAYQEKLLQRSRHIPLQQIQGYTEFMGLKFQVNSNVLCPRQDTENLVEEVLKCLHDGMRVLDMCTGSGCILLSLLQYSNDTTGIGVDLSGDALQVAKANAESLGMQERASYVQGDLFENVDGKFDIIVSNPPYIRSEVIPTLMEEVKDHEPMMALDGMEDGLFFYRKIIQAAGEYLWGGGKLFFEIGFDQGQQVSELMRECGYQEVKVLQDYAGLDRVVFGEWKCLIN